MWSNIKYDLHLSHQCRQTECVEAKTTQTMRIFHMLMVHCSSTLTVEKGSEPLNEWLEKQIWRLTLSGTIRVKNSKTWTVISERRSEPCMSHCDVEKHSNLWSLMFTRRICSCQTYFTQISEELQSRTADVHVSEGGPSSACLVSSSSSCLLCTNTRSKRTKHKPGRSSGDVSRCCCSIISWLSLTFHFLLSSVESRRLSELSLPPSFPLLLFASVLTFGSPACLSSERPNDGIDQLVTQRNWQDFFHPEQRPGRACLPWWNFHSWLSLTLGDKGRVACMLSVLTEENGWSFDNRTPSNWSWSCPGVAKSEGQLHKRTPAAVRQKLRSTLERLVTMEGFSSWQDRVGGELRTQKISVRAVDSNKVGFNHGTDCGCASANGGTVGRMDELWRRIRSAPKCGVHAEATSN